MNILFYVEPHPMRENLVEFYWIVEELIKMLKDEFSKEYTVSTNNIKLLCSRYIHAEINKNFSEIDEFILGMTKEENDLIIEKYNKKWTSESLKTWESLLRGSGEVSENYEKILERVYSSYKYDVIVYWGTNGAVKNISKKYNIPSVAMELGCTRVPFFQSVYFDYNGVNGASYLNNIDLEKVKIKYTLKEIETFLPLQQLKEKSLDGRFDVLEHSLSDKIYSNIGKNILIPLQLMDDTNIILYSKYNSMEEFLKDVIPSLTNKGFTCFIKPHPGNVVREINKNDHLNCKFYCESFSNVYWLEGFNNNKELVSLYNKMSAFVVVNSSVGFEAMLLGKVVVPLGKSPYNLSSKLPTLNALIEGNINKESYNIEITKIVNLMLFNYLYFKDESFNYTSFIKALEFNINLFFSKNDEFEFTVLTNMVNTKVNYLNYPPRKKINKNIVFQEVVTNLENNYVFMPKVKSKLKKIPVLGKFLVRIKNKFN